MPPAGGPVPPQASSTKLSKGKTIGIVVVALAVLAALGVGAAVAFGRDGDLPPGLNGGSPTPLPSGVTTPPTPSGTLSPTPVATGGIPTPITPTPTATDPLPSPTETLPPNTPSVTLTIQGTEIVTVPVPAPWGHSPSSDGSQVSMGDGSGNFMWIGVFVGSPSDTASGIIAANRDSLVIAQNYSGLQWGEVQTLQPAGSMVSFAAISYHGIWNDSQGSMELGGMLWVALRSDGAIFAMTTETNPPSAFSTASFSPVGDPALNDFAGLI